MNDSKLTSYVEGGLAKILNSGKANKKLKNFFEKKPLVLSDLPVESFQKSKNNNIPLKEPQNDIKKNPKQLKKKKKKHSKPSESIEVVSVNPTHSLNDEDASQEQQNVSINPDSNNLKKLKRKKKKQEKGTKRLKLLENSSLSIKIDEDHDPESEANMTPQEKKQDDPEKLSRTLFVGNLPVNIKPKDLKILFKEHGKVESVRLRSAIPAKPDIPKKIAVVTRNYHPDKQSINAYVVMENESDAKKAKVLNGHLIQKNHIRVDIAIKKAFDPKRSIFVGNLAFNINDEDIWNFFEECGQIEAVRVIRDMATGIGKGFGYVVFQSVDSLMLALQKNENELNGRILRVFRCKKCKINDSGQMTRNTERVPVGGIQSNALRRIQGKQQRLTNGAPSKIPSFQGVRSTESRKERLKVEHKIKAYKRNVKGKKILGKQNSETSRNLNPN